ncbi:MAG: hypothetical protein AAF715_32565, partial [Myxococcota bacterium]
TVVQAVADETTDVTLQLTIPDSVGSGGSGLGWVDDAPWPPLNGQNSVALASSPTGTVITVNATTTTAPTVGATVAWWSSHDLRFHVREVLSWGGSSGAWTLQLDAPLIDSDGNAAPAGDYISPAAVNMEAYGATFRDGMRNLGPGENTTDDFRLPRAARHPYPETDWPSGITSRLMQRVLNAHQEISDWAWIFRSKALPTVPANVALPPNVLVLRHFGIYRDA